MSAHKHEIIPRGKPQASTALAAERGWRATGVGDGVGEGDGLGIGMIPPQVHLRRPCYDFYFL